MKRVIIGGTFEILHKGHKFLLEKAFSLGKVTIGLTSNLFAQSLKHRKVKDFKERKKTIEEFIQKRGFKKAKIVKINDIFGPTLKEDFDFIVVSPETKKRALIINKERKKLGKTPIKIIQIPFVLAEDKKPISCTRILNGEIDPEGRECVFCKIVKGKIKALKIYEDKKFLAFLDKKPRNPGHSLVIPKAHFRWVIDVPYIDKYFKVVQKIALALKRALEADWVILPVLGDEIWHAHVHLIPRFKNDNFHYSPPPVKLISKKEMLKIQREIIKNL